MIAYLRALPKVRMTVSDRWKKRTCVLRYWEYADALRKSAEDQNFRLSDEISIVFYFKPSPSKSKKVREAMYGKPHKQKPDIDNLLKAVMDILRKEGDESIWNIQIRKYWAEENKIIIENIS